MCHTSVCCKCFSLGKTTHHHIFPKRFFPNNNHALLHICRECHNEIETLLPRGYKLTKQEYRDIHRDWLRGIPIMISHIRRRQ